MDFFLLPNFFQSILKFILKVNDSKKKANTQREVEIPSTGSSSTWPQCPRQDQTKSRNEKVHLSLALEWQGPKSWAVFSYSFLAIS